jgi:hypothetical protein
MRNKYAGSEIAPVDGSCKQGLISNCVESLSRREEKRFQK